MAEVTEQSLLEKMIRDPRKSAEYIEDTLQIIPDMIEKHPRAFAVGSGVMSAAAASYILGEVQIVYGSPVLEAISQIAKVGVAGATGVFAFKSIDKYGGPAEQTVVATVLPPTPNQQEVEVDVGKPLAFYRSGTANRIKAVAKQKHVIVDGGTGGGKTVFLTGMAEYLVARYGWEYFVIDPKSDGDPELKWPSATLKLYEQKEFIPFLKQANVELNRRKADPNKNYRHMVIIVDEAPEVTGASEEAVELVARLSKLGFSAHIHVWLASQSFRIAEVGFAGRKDLLLHNFVAVKLREEMGKYQFASMRRTGDEFRVVGEWDETPHLWHGWKNLADKPVEDSNLLRMFATETPQNKRNAENSVERSVGLSAGLDEIVAERSAVPSPSNPPVLGGSNGRVDGTKTERNTSVLDILVRASEKGVLMENVIQALVAQKAGNPNVTELTRILLSLTGDVGGKNRDKTRYILGLE